MWTQADVDRMKAAVSSGVLSVTYDGPPSRTVTYQNLDSMRALLAEMVAEVETAAGRRSNYKLAATRKGFE